MGANVSRAATGQSVSEEAGPAVPFPSVAWFERLASYMNTNRARQEQLGYVDCVARFVVSDGAPGSTPWSVQVTFEEFAVTKVCDGSGANAHEVDFSMEATLATWREMIESIRRGHGRPDLEHTLNRLSNMDTPLRVRSNDPLRRDLYFRYNQSLQEFVNAAGRFETNFAARAE
jgi:hypothetical protein